MTETNVYNTSTVPIQTVAPVVPIPAAKRSYSRIYGRNEVLDGEYKLYQKLIAEFLGTAFFVYGVCGSNIFFVGVPIVAVLASSFFGGLIIYLFGRVSGAHFNPAVSLGLLIRQKLAIMEFIYYVVAQLLGSILGCVLLGLCVRGKFKYLAGNEISNFLIYGDVGKGKRDAWCYISALISEIIGTFILIMFILASCERDNYLGPMLGLGFASTLIALNGAGGNVSGCSLNPARSFGPALVQVMASGFKNPIKQIWIYIVGPLLGAAIAGFVWPFFLYGTA